MVYLLNSLDNTQVEVMLLAVIVCVLTIVLYDLNESQCLLVTTLGCMNVLKIKLDIDKIAITASSNLFHYNALHNTNPYHLSRCMPVTEINTVAHEHWSHQNTGTS